MITLIHLRDSAFVGGPEKQILGQSARLDRSRFEPTVVSFSSDGESALTEAAMEEGILAECLPDGKLHLPRAIGCLRGLLRRCSNPVVVTSGFRADITACYACSAERVPWIAWFHGFTASSAQVRLYESLDFHALRWAHRVIAICERTACMLRARGLSNTVVIPNGIDAPAVRSAGDRGTARRELTLADGDLAVGIVSRLSVEKGIGVFVRAAADILRVHPNSVFPIIGDGPTRASLERQAKRLEIARRMIFTGHRQDAVALMKGLDIFVLPSFRENLPVALLEAMVCGISIVATDVGGVGDVLARTPAKPVPPGSSKALVDAILALLADPGMRRAHGEAHMKRVDDFSFERHVLAMEELLEGVSRSAASAARTEAARQSGGHPYRGD